VAFSPDGKFLPTASADHTTRLWNLRFTSWVTQGCKIVNRNLSITEWSELTRRGPTYEEPARAYSPGRELQKTLQPPPVNGS
jgi:WD40 repeat protein